MQTARRRSIALQVSPHESLKMHRVQASVGLAFNSTVQEKAKVAALLLRSF